LAELTIVDGLDSATFTAPDSYFQDAIWCTTQLTSTAVSTSTTLSLSSRNANGAFDAIVDNVKVQSVPEPFSMGVLRLGAMILYRRRQR
jgi:hypothetical protein